jgi:hypothetical protein
VVLGFIGSRLSAVVHLMVEDQVIKKVHVVAGPNTVGLLPQWPPNRNS